MAFDLDVVFDFRYVLVLLDVLVLSVVLVTVVVLSRVFISISGITIEKTTKEYAGVLLLGFYIFLLRSERQVYTEMSNTPLSLDEEFATEDLGRRVFQPSPLLNLLTILFVALGSLKPRKHQPELNASLINPASKHCVVVSRARIVNCASTTNIYCSNIDNSGSGVGEPFQLRWSENTSFWKNEDVKNEGIKVGCVVEYRVLTCYQSPLGRYCKLGKRDGKQFIFHRNDRKPPLGINELLKDLQDKNVLRRREQLCGYVNLKADRFQGLLGKLYTKLYMARTRIYFIGIRAFTIKDERVILETMGKEVVDMPLNCRENLVLSTASVYMPLERPRKVADDDGDDSVDSDDSDDHGVPGVAVIKIEACEVTCEGLISRYKPFIISRDEEPVDIMNASGSWIRVQGRQSGWFDTGNTAAACISEELLQKLDLEVDWEDTVPVHLAGVDGEFPAVQVELKIRQHHFEGLALVGAVPEGLHLLVGMEIIQELFDLGYTIGK